MKKLLRIVSSLLPTEIAYAHCDVPCGIYDPKAAQVAAATVLKMVQKMNELEQPDMNSKQSTMDYHNAITRYVWTKEEHARKCKEEILILWTDYFKPEHLGKYPNLHDMFWKAAKLCSENKQHVSIESAEALVKAVDEIAHVFAETKTAK